MPNSPLPIFSVSDFLAVCNQTLDFSFNRIAITGEVASFKVNQNRWVFFDLKDADSTISCFIPLFQLRSPLADGMTIVATGTPKVTKWGKFSFTIQHIQISGAGNLKKSFELLKAKLQREGLFDPARKRPLPHPPHKLGIISSINAAGYADFIKILNARWGGIEILTAHTAVQGSTAPDQIIKALNYFNQKTDVDLIAILRGGGSADDLSCFNDEPLVRQIASSRIPIITGIGHEIDQSLSDLAADFAASTPSNAAELITPDRHAISVQLHTKTHNLNLLLKNKIDELSNNQRQKIQTLKEHLKLTLTTHITHLHQQNTAQIARLKQQFRLVIDNLDRELQAKNQLLSSINPEAVLKRGYAIVSGDTDIGNIVKITTLQKIIYAEVKNVQNHS